MLSVVIRPFKSGGVFYPAGTIVDPAGITLYKSKIGENKIKVVDEHNLDEVARFLELRHGQEDAHKVLSDAVSNRKAYLNKVNEAAKKYQIDVAGKTTEEVVAEVKAKQADAKAKETKTGK